MGPPWLVLSTSKGKVRGPRPWPLNHTNCMVPEEGWTEGLVLISNPPGEATVLCIFVMVDA